MNLKRISARERERNKVLTSQHAPSRPQSHKRGRWLGTHRHRCSPPSPSWPASPSPLRSAPLTQSAHSSTSSGAGRSGASQGVGREGGTRALGSVADFPFSCHFREGGRGRGQPLHGATGEPASQASGGKHKGSRPSSDGMVTWLSHCPSCWGQTGPRGAPSPVLRRHPPKPSSRATWPPRPTCPWPPCRARPSQGRRAVHTTNIYSPDWPC